MANWGPEESENQRFLVGDVSKNKMIQKFDSERIKKEYIRHSKWVSGKDQVKVIIRDLESCYL